MGQGSWNVTIPIPKWAQVDMTNHVRLSREKVKFERAFFGPEMRSENSIQLGLPLIRVNQWTHQR